MIGTLIVMGSVVFAAAFTVAWLVRPGLRTWLEKPKHRFKANIERYDRAAVDNRYVAVSSGVTNDEDPYD